MKHTSKQWIAAAMSAVLTLSCATPAFAAAPAVPVSDGRKMTCDEAYYATLDYYGNLTDASIVKSYVLNGASSITDFGEYESVSNLTDSTVPSEGAKRVAFDFADAAPSHFYFEGKAKKPYENLPWTISLSYTLNGVPMKAEDIAGKTGVVEIIIDAIPNKNADEYARNNYTLEAMSVFNQDDILSLDAPGGQTQLVGNLRAALFITLPGEEGHYTIRVGTDSFEYGGMTFLMVPATLSQLEEISKLGQRKDDLEDSYNKLSGSLDTLLDSLADMEGSLNGAAAGLDRLNKARATVSANKGKVYDDADELRGNIDDFLTVLDPVNDQLEDASSAITETNDALRELVDGTNGLKGDLAKLEKDLKALQDGKGDTKEVLSDIGNLRGSLLRLRNALNNVKTSKIDPIDDPFAGKTTEEVETAVNQANMLHDDVYMHAIKAYIATKDYSTKSALTAMLYSSENEAGFNGEGFEDFLANYLYTAAARASSPISKSAAKVKAKEMYAAYTTMNKALAAANKTAPDDAVLATAAGKAWKQVNQIHAAYDQIAMDFDRFIIAALIANGTSNVTATYTALAGAYAKIGTTASEATPYISSSDAITKLYQAVLTGIKTTASDNSSSNPTLAGLLNSITDGDLKTVMAYVKAEQAKDSSISMRTALTSAFTTLLGNKGADSSTAGTIATALTTLSSGGSAADSQITQAYTGIQAYETLGGLRAAFVAAGGVDGTVASSTSDGSTVYAVNYDANPLDFEHFLYALMYVNYSGDTAKAKTDADSLYSLYTMKQNDQTGITDLVTGNADKISETISNLNKSIKNLNQSLASLAGLTGPSSELMQKLADLSDDIEDLSGLVDDADALIGNSADLVDKLPGILDDVDALQGVIDKYEPVAQDAIDNAQDIASTMNKTLEDTGTFADSFEDFMQTSGYELDEGTRASLSSLAATLRDVAKSVSTTNDVKDAKDIVSELIEDTWNDYTGDVNNLLLMDATAEPVSLTDPRNPSPKSVQVLIRTQEIKVEEPEAVTVSANTSTAESGPTTFWGRVAAMFTTMWYSVVSRLHHA